MGLASSAHVQREPTSDRRTTISLLKDTGAPDSVPFQFDNLGIDSIDDSVSSISSQESIESNDEELMDAAAYEARAKEMVSHIVGGWTSSNKE